MDPPLKIYDGILRLVAEFAVPVRELSSLAPRSDPQSWLDEFHLRRAPVDLFNKGHLQYFDVSNNGFTATRKAGGWGWRYVCASPSLDSGALPIADNRQPTS